MKTMLKGIRFKLVFFVLMLFGISCQMNKVGPVDYIRDLEANKGLNKRVQIGNLEYSFHVSTPEVMALKDCTDAKGRVDKISYEKRLQELRGFIFLSINQRLKNSEESVLKYNLTDRTEYERRVMYYEFHAQNDIRMICAGKEVAPESFQYQNHMGLAPYNTLVMVFPHCEGVDEWQIIFNDQAFNNLFIKASFANKDIDKLPELVLK